MDNNEKPTRNLPAIVACAAVAVILLMAGAFAAIDAVKHYRHVKALEGYVETYVNPADTEGNVLSDRLIGVPSNTTITTELGGTSNVLITTVITSYDTYGGLDVVRTFATIPNVASYEDFGHQVNLLSTVIIPARESSIAWLFKQESFDEVVLDYLRNLDETSQDAIYDANEAAKVLGAAKDKEASICNVGQTERSLFNSTTATCAYLLEYAEGRLGLEVRFEWDGGKLTVDNVRIDELPVMDKASMGNPIPLWEKQ